MKSVVILGAGTAGTMVANRLARKLPADWSLTIVDPEPRHLYQPDLLFLPFEMRGAAGMERPRQKTLAPRVRWVREEIHLVDTDQKTVALTGGGRLPYDLLVIATGCQPHPEETPGLLGASWRETIHDFYTLDGALALRDALARFDGGRLVVNIVEMPIKCPVAPIEFAFLADDYFTRRGIRDRVEIVLATPLDGCFTKPVASRVLTSMLWRKGVAVDPLFNAALVDGEARVVRSWDEREIPFDLLVAIPTHRGAAFVGASGLGNELDFIPTERHTLLAKGYDDVFALGDATDLPSSKAGSVAHFQSDAVVENVLRAIRGRSLAPGFDGHANCFIESGFGKALLIDFNYDVEPLPGRFPLPWLGPLSLLHESRINHWGKLAFRPLYWHALLPGRPLPLPNRMSMLGKRSADSVLEAQAS